MRILLLLLLIGFNAQGQNFRQLMKSPTPQPPEEEFTLSKISVKYTNDDAAYITSKSGFQDDATFNSGVNVIGLCTIVPDDNANSSLAYDQETDRLVVLQLNASGHVGYKFFDKPSLRTAFSAALGTIPTPDQTVVASGLHGHAIDPVNQILYVWYLGNTIREYDIATGTLLASRTNDAGYSTPGTISYDYETGDMWIIIGTETVQAAKRMRLVSGNWETQESTWFTFTQEIIVDPVFDGLITKRTSGSTGRLVYILQKFDGSEPRLFEYPLNTPQFEANTQNCVRDARNGTFWLNVDIQYHEDDFGASLPNENVIVNMDPLGYYQKYIRFPDMHRFELCKLTSSLSGQYNAQTLTGNDWDVLPVVDYNTYTGQQTLSNWEYTASDSVIFEFRGSDTPPSTTEIDDYDNSNIKLYDANGSNDGWGSTTPGSWGSTPTSHRYMQARVKMIQDSPAWTPWDLGADLIAWFQMDTTNNLYYDAISSNQCEFAINAVTPANNLSANTNSQRPQFNTTDHYLDMTASNRHYNASTTLRNQVVGLSECEVHVVARKNANTSRVIMLSASQAATANNQLVLQWNPSNVAPNNLLHATFTDASGNISTMGYTDTDVTPWSMFSFRLGGTGPNKIYKNGVEQTLTTTGSVDNFCYDDVSAGIDIMRVARTSQSGTSVAAVQRQRDIFITTHLSDADRAKLVTYSQNNGTID